MRGGFQQATIVRVYFPEPFFRSRCQVTRLSRVALMGELTASLAHELIQPLTAIASNAAARKRFLARGAPDVAMFEELLDDVFADARRAGDIIHGINHLVRKDEEPPRR